nr:hypothetical protein CFP56_16652 [Quercus suber]
MTHRKAVLPGHPPREPRRRARRTRKQRTRVEQTCTGKRGDMGRKQTPLSSSHRLDLLALDGLPLDQAGADGGERGEGDGDVEGVLDGGVVGDEDGGQVLGGDVGLEVGGTGVEDVVGVEAGRGRHEAGEEGVGEDVLRDGDEEGAAEGLGEDDDRGADGHVGRGQHRLRGDEALLGADAEAEAVED